MENLRKYGNEPYSMAVIHGGPGAPGQMAPVARELSLTWGVLEPMQTSSTIEGQVEELKTILTTEAELPITLVGFSWGAMLSFIFTACYPAIVKKLVLISSGVYEEKYARNIMELRLKRLNEKEKKEVARIIDSFNNPLIKDKNTLLARFGELMTKSDACDLLPYDSEILEFQYDINASISEEAIALRSSGELLKMAGKISCPVIAIHGDTDPHLVEGVREPLSRVIKDFHFILLEKCGHCPWYERQAKEKFYQALKTQLEE